MPIVTINKKPIHKYSEEELKDWIKYFNKHLANQYSPTSEYEANEKDDSVTINGIPINRLSGEWITDSIKYLNKHLVNREIDRSAIVLSAMIENDTSEDEAEADAINVVNVNDDKSGFCENEIKDTPIERKNEVDDSTIDDSTIDGGSEENSRTSRVQEEKIEKGINISDEESKIETKAKVSRKRKSSKKTIDEENKSKRFKKKIAKTVNNVSKVKQPKVHENVETIEDVIVDSDSESEDIDEEKDSTNEVSVEMMYINEYESNKKKSISRSKDVIVVSDSESEDIDVEKDDSTNEVPVEMMYINESNKKKSIFRSKYSIKYDSLGNPSGVKINYSREDRENVEDAMKIWSKDRIGSTFEEVSRNFFVLKRFVIKILCKKGYDIKLNSVEDLDKLDDVINTELKIIGLNIFEFRFPNIEKVLKGLDLIEKP